MVELDSIKQTTLKDGAKREVKANKTIVQKAQEPQDKNRSTEANIHISMAYAPIADTQLYKSIQIAHGATIYDALKQTGWLEMDEELARWCMTHAQTQIIDKKSWRVGVHSQKRRLDYVLKNNDRVEVYRPLTIDPQSRRRGRADT